jgi:hypothetical protein
MLKIMIKSETDRETDRLTERYVADFPYSGRGGTCGKEEIGCGFGKRVKPAASQFSSGQINHSRTEPGTHLHALVWQADKSARGTSYAVDWSCIQIICEIHNTVSVPLFFC